MSVISRKTKLFIKGHMGLMSSVASSMKDNAAPVVWVHSPSYGEFEEVRPVLKVLRERCPEYRILVTFFSPSGYEYLKNDPAADWVFYLPLDTPWNASRFLDLVKPVTAIFAIADFWLCHLYALRRRKIPTFLVSGRFHPGMSYFKFFGKAYLNAFRKCFTRMIVNTPESVRTLRANGVENAVTVGDPRMDRVLSLAAEEWSDSVISEWCGGKKVFVGGSILPDEDDGMMAVLANSHPDDKFLIVPHEPGEGLIARLMSTINGRTALYTAPDPSAQVLIVNVIGILSRSYRYGFAAYVGGGFDGAPHSVIEPASYGIPVSFGPQFGPVWHCESLIACGAGKSVADVRELLSWYDNLKASPEFLENSGKAAKEYCEKGRGAAEKTAAIINISCGR